MNECNKPGVGKGITAMTIEGVPGVNKTENLRHIGITVTCNTCCITLHKDRTSGSKEGN